MDIEIDQSGKIENTNKDTVIAFSDDRFSSILIKAKDKREIQKIFRQIGKSRIFVHRLFAILIFLVIKDYLKKIDEIIIDEEYPGKSSLIKNLLFHEIKKIKSDFPGENISFRKIGKKSKAHLIAIEVTHKKIEPRLKVGINNVLKYIVK